MRRQRSILPNRVKTSHFPSQLSPSTSWENDDRIKLQIQKVVVGLFSLITIFIVHSEYNAVAQVRASGGNGDKIWEVRKNFEPLPEDNVGIPNVVYGCGEVQMREIDEIQIHVIGWGRVEAMAVLLRQLRDANYDNWNKDIPMNIHLDGGSFYSDEIGNIAKGLAWNHGPHTVIKQKENVGVRTMWLDSIGAAAEKAGNNTLMLVFEDDTRVSPDYFQWLLALIDQYARHPQCRDSNLMGFSLSPMLIREMTNPHKSWDARPAMGRRYNNDYRHLVYLSAVPSSWGAAYWSDRWTEFDRFVRLRMQPPFYDLEAEKVEFETFKDLKMSPEVLHIPDSRSNFISGSWKRFMVDFMFARGNVMMYPSLPGQKGFAVSLQNKGEQVWVWEKSRASYVSVPGLWDDLDIESLGNLPRYGDLAVFSHKLWPVNREELAIAGMNFLQNISRYCTECNELVRFWARPGILTDVKYLVPRENDIGRPPICMADLYTSAAAAASRPKSPSRAEKYLLFEPPYGVNQQILAVVTAYYWARALNRRLVLPPIVMPHGNDMGSSRLIEMEKVFRVSDIDHPDLLPPGVKFDHPALTPIGFAQFASMSKKPWRLIRATRDDISSKSFRVLTPVLQAQNLQVVNLRHMLNQDVPVDQLQQLLGGCDDEVLAFDGLYFAKLQSVDPKSVIPDVMQYTEELSHLYHAVKEKFLSKIGSTKFACYHVPLGEDLEDCQSICNSNSNFDLADGHSYACNVTAKEVISAIGMDKNPAFIISDIPSILHEVMATVPQATVTSDWVVETVTNSFYREVDLGEIQLFSLIVEQSLCADAYFSHLNFFSAISQQVVSLRRGKSYKYWMK